MPPINLLIKPASGSCNMRCRYCFYMDETSKREEENYGMMSLETLETVIRKALAETEGALDIGFQGGEPTLRGLDFYRKLIEIEKKLKNAGFKQVITAFYGKDVTEDEVNQLEPEDLDPKDLIKLCIIGSEDECSIVLTDDNLINGVYFLPIVSKIYIARAIEEDLFKELKRYCEDNEIELDVITSKTI